MFKITLKLINNKGKALEITEEGNVLKEMELKKDLKNKILHHLKENKHSSGFHLVDLFVEEDGEHYKSVEFAVFVNPEYSDLQFVA